MHSYPGMATTQQREHDAKVTPSGPKGDNPATAGPGHTEVRSSTPENKAGEIDPAAPGETGTTPGSTKAPGE
ncbi:MAG: hypothetical protein JF584_01540 [Acidobacteria bacterium]|nr:hypothetical protein [Acidobacteriota bacterium]